MESAGAYGSILSKIEAIQEIVSLVTSEFQELASLIPEISESLLELKHLLEKMDFSATLPNTNSAKEDSSRTLSVGNTITTAEKGKVYQANNYPSKTVVENSASDSGRPISHGSTLKSICGKDEGCKDTDPSDGVEQQKGDNKLIHQSYNSQPSDPVKVMQSKEENNGRLVNKKDKGHDQMKTCEKKLSKKRSVQTSRGTKSKRFVQKARETAETRQQITESETLEETRMVSASEKTEAMAVHAKETTDTGVANETMDTETANVFSKETMDPEAQAMTDISKETTDTDPPGQTKETETMADIAKEAIETEIVNEAIETEIMTDIAKEAIKTEIVNEAIETEIMTDIAKEAIKTEIVNEAIETEIMTDIAKEAIETEMVNEAIETEIMTEITKEAIDSDSAENEGNEQKKTIGRDEKSIKSTEVTGEIKRPSKRSFLLTIFSLVRLIALLFLNLLWITFTLFAVIFVVDFICRWRDSGIKLPAT